MDEALAMHDECLRSALHTHCGYEVRPLFINCFITDFFLTYLTVFWFLLDHTHC